MVRKGVLLTFVRGLPATDAANPCAQSYRPEAVDSPVAAWVVDRAEEVRGVLKARLNWHPNRQLSLRTLLIGAQMLGKVGRRQKPPSPVRLGSELLAVSVQRALNVVDGRGAAVSYRQIDKGDDEDRRILESRTVPVDHDHDVAVPETGEVFQCPTSGRCPGWDSNSDL